jgi:hypothetical protein
LNTQNILNYDMKKKLGHHSRNLTLIKEGWIEQRLKTNFACRKGLAILAIKLRKSTDEFWKGSPSLKFQCEKVEIK